VAEATSSGRGSAFRGFDSSGSSLAVPETFFTDLLPAIRSPVELKLTLHLMWLLSRRHGRPKCIEYRTLSEDTALIASLKVQDGPRPGEDFLREGLERAVARGSVLELRLRRDGTVEAWYFLNTDFNRAWIGGASEGRIEANDIFGGSGIQEIKVSRPNIFALYEQNIGSLTALMAERLRSAEKEYPAEWIEEAIQLAVEYNKRNWRYVEAILQRWLAEGKTHGTNRGNPEEDDDPYGYFRSRYQHLYH
jgi:DNA replication protein